MNRPDDPDAVVRDLLRQPRPAPVDADRAARVRPAVHAAWKEAAGGTRTWKRVVARAGAAGGGCWVERTGEYPQRERAP